jgi:hypothetical protein
MEMCQGPGLYVIKGPRKSGKTTFVKRVLHALGLSKHQSRINHIDPTAFTTNDHYELCFDVETTQCNEENKTNRIHTYVFDESIISKKKLNRWHLYSKTSNMRTFVVFQGQHGPSGLFVNHVTAWFYLSCYYQIFHLGKGQSIAFSEIPSIKHNVTSVADLPAQKMIIQETTQLIPEIVGVIVTFVETVPYCQHCIACL